MSFIMGCVPHTQAISVTGNWLHMSHFLFQQDTMDKFGTGHDWSPKSPGTQLGSISPAVEIVLQVF